MKVQNIMTTNVASCSPETNLAAAAGLLWDYDCGSLPVVDGEGKVDRAYFLLLKRSKTMP